MSITDQMVDDILCAALEGGISYWAIAADSVGPWPEGAEFPSEVLTRGGELVITVDPDVEDDNAPPRILTLKNFKRGIRKEAKRRGLTVERFYEEHDAGTADNAVQWALFNELVYG